MEKQILIENVDINIKDIQYTYVMGAGRKGKKKNKQHLTKWFSKTDERNQTQIWDILQAPAGYIQIKEHPGTSLYNCWKPKSKKLLAAEKKDEASFKDANKQLMILMKESEIQKVEWHFQCVSDNPTTWLVTLPPMPNETISREAN